MLLLLDFTLKLKTTVMDKASKRSLLSLLACVCKDSQLDFTGTKLTEEDCLTLRKFLPNCKFDVILDSCSINAEQCKTLFRPDAKYDIKSIKYVYIYNYSLICVIIVFMNSASATNKTAVDHDSCN